MDVIGLQGKLRLSSLYARETHRDDKTKEPQQKCNSRKQTDRLAVHQLEDFGGPDDEYDGSCGHKVNNGVTLMSVRGNPSWSKLVLTDNREDESVGEVLIQREFHHVSPKLQEASGLRQTDENVDVN